MTKLDDAVSVTGFKQEAEALLAIANVLDGRCKEESCAILAAVSSVLGFYDQAEKFLDMARHWREITDQALEMEAQEAGTP
jgi:hypothetical protein